MKTPTKNPHAVALGRLGGKAGTGEAKRRDTAKKAALVRWANYRKSKEGKV